MSIARRLLPASLRARLLSGIVLLVAVGLVGTDLGAYQITRIWVLRRASEVSADAMARVNLALKLYVRQEVTAAQLSSFSVGEGYALYYDQRGDLLLPPGSRTPQQADLARALGPLRAATISRRAGHTGSITVDGNAYQVEYLSTVGPVLVTDAARPGTPIRGIVIAISVQGAYDTLATLAATEEIVTFVALLVLAGAAIVVLWLGLRPLAEIAAVAKANAAGDTDRRAPTKRHATEVDRVATALNHAFDQRRHAEDQLRRFVADASHELRTPLTTIRGWAELYFQDDLTEPEAVRTAMIRIADEATRMSTLVDELLLLARMDQPRPLDLAPVDLAPVVREVVDDAGVVDPSRPITLTMPTEPLEVMGEPDRLRQMLRNLVGNAFQHTPPGTAVRVTVEESPRDRLGDLRILVADDGPGIAQADRPHLFTRFYRSGAAHDGSGGTGLGLAITHAIVTAHHGTIDLLDEPGGATFLVTLPRAPSRPTPTAPSQGRGAVTKPKTNAFFHR